LTAALLAVLDQFDHRWGALVSQGFAVLAEDYRRRCFLTGKTVTLQQPAARPLIGLCRGIDDRGCLRLASEVGEVAVASGTVQKWE
jgi:biotin-(acetyl-CoA carboxylase) ligase